MIRVTKIKVKKDHRRKGEKGGVIYKYTVIVWNYFSIHFKISIGQVGWKKVDIQIRISRGWES